MGTLEAYLAKRDALFRAPSLEGAVEILPIPLGGWARPDVPLAALHKARLQWLGATDAMLKESAEWLTANGYKISFQGAPPLSPEKRDTERQLHGLPPLASVS